MPVLTIRCSHCAAEFVDSRASLQQGDEVTCPSCGARHEFTREFIESEGGEDGTRVGSAVHAGPEFRKPPAG